MNFLASLFSSNDRLSCFKSWSSWDVFKVKNSTIGSDVRVAAFKLSERLSKTNLVVLFLLLTGFKRLRFWQLLLKSEFVFVWSDVNQFVAHGLLASACAAFENERPASSQPLECTGSPSLFNSSRNCLLNSTGSVSANYCFL